MPTLFDPIDLGGLHLPNRIFMAPLTRARAVDRRIPNDLMREYYVQRATAGLIPARPQDEATKTVLARAELLCADLA